jgi:hypothetical protein
MARRATNRRFPSPEKKRLIFASGYSRTFRVLWELAVFGLFAVEAGWKT